MDTIHIEKRTFPVLDMSCAACAARVDKTLNGQPGVRTASVNYAAATATVEYDTAQCSPEQLKAALQAAGYDLLVGDDRKQLEDRAEQAHDEKYRRLRQRTVWAIVLALPVAVIGMFFMHTPYADLISWALSTPVVLWLGRDFHRNAWRQLRHGTANMDTLVSNSTLIAYVFSLFNMLFPEFWTARGVEPHVYFEAASVIIVFVLLVGTIVYKKIKFKDLLPMMIRSAVMSAAILMIASMAGVMGWVLAIDQIPQKICNLMISMTNSRIAVLFIIQIFLLFVGMFMDAAPAVLILVPVFMPIMKQYGIDPVHFGLLMCFNLTIGVLTPPVGTCLYTTAMATGVPVDRMIKGIWPWIGVLVVVLFICTYWEGLILFIPRLLGYGV